jgi:hypothetical protein
MSDVVDFSDRRRARQPEPERPEPRSYRRASRVKTHRAVAIYSRRNGRTARKVARLRDYSTSGIGLVSADPVEPGTRFAVRLVRPDGRKIALVFDVVYCEPGENGTYSLGGAIPTAPKKLKRKDFSTSLTGSTVSGWGRVLDVRAEGDRVWVNMHPPDKESGWGMWLERAELENVLLAA